MKRIRIMGLCLVAVLAVSAVAASVASARSEYITKAPVGTMAAAVKVMDGPAGYGVKAKSYLEGTNLSKIKCELNGTTKGEVVGPDESLNNLTIFKGCETNGLPCQNAGAGEIETKKLKGELGDLTEYGKPETPAVDFTPEPPETHSASFECGGIIHVETEGGAVGTTSGASGTEAGNNVAPASLTLTFAQSNGKAKYVKWYGKEEKLTTVITGAVNETGGSAENATVVTASSPAKDLGVTK